MGDILSDAVHVCRKARTCDQCNRLIQVGQRYRKQVHTFDGFTTYRAHEDCDAAYSKMKKLAGNAWRDDDLYFPLSDIAHRQDDAWIRDEFPVVAERIWGQPTHQQSGERSK